MNSYTHEIVRMERGETSGSKSPMWRCTTKDGQRVNVFQHSDPKKDSSVLFMEAGYFAAMETLKVGERDLARMTGYSRSTLENHRPTAFERRGWIKRVVRGGMYFYQSTVRTFFKANYPDLDIDDLVQRICKLEKL